MNENDAKTQPTLETIVEMLRALQLQVSEVNTRLDVMQADIAEIKSDIVVIKAEQDRQGRQLDEMAKNLYRFAGDPCELRLVFKELRQAS